MWDLLPGSRISQFAVRKTFEQHAHNEVTSEMVLKKKSIFLHLSGLKCETLARPLDVIQIVKNVITKITFAIKAFLPLN